MINNINTEYFSESELRRFKFHKIGKNVLISKSCVIKNCNNISIGNNVRVDSYSIILTRKKKVNIGNYVHIGAYSFLGAHMGLTLKSFSGLGQGVKIFTVNDDYSGESLTNPMTSAKFKKEKNGSVVIGKHVNIGSNSIILPNVKIGDGASIGSFTLVNNNLTGWKIYFGIPAKPLLGRSKKLLEHEKNFLKNEKRKQS